MKVLTTLAAALTVAGSASAAQVWVAPASVKVRPATQPAGTAPTQATLAAAQNEFESFHVVVTGQASGVSMAFESLTDGQGHSISGRELVLYREAIINVQFPSGGDGAAGMWPDALIPNVDPIVGEKRNAFPFDVPAGESRAVLVDIHAPAGTPAGLYHGNIVVTGGVSANIPVTLNVWDFAVPSTSTLKSAFALAWNGPCMGHGDSGCSNVPFENALRARYVQAALDNHISISTPYNGYTEPVIASGATNWTAFDQYAGPFLDGTAPTRLQGAKLTTSRMGGAITAPVVGAWATHFKQHGWPQLFTYVCDEPPMTCAWSDIATRSAASHAGDASVPTLVTTTPAQAKAQGATGIDLFVPVVNDMDSKVTQQGSQRTKYPATAWWYQSCDSFGCSSSPGTGSGQTGWPSYAIDTDGTRNRAQEWMSYVYNMQGELYYEVTQGYFNGDPWVNQWNFGGTGDGNLFYPGTPAKIGGTTEIPVESLRMKGIRDGMEDYELLALATRLGLGAQAMTIAQGLFPHTYLSISSADAIDAARAELAGLILHALNKAPAPVVGPSPATPIVNTSIPLAKAAAGGCASGGTQTAWLALPLVALVATLRRRRTLAGPRN